MIRGHERRETGRRGLGGRWGGLAVLAVAAVVGDLGGVVGCVEVSRRDSGEGGEVGVDGIVAGGDAPGDLGDGGSGGDGKGEVDVKDPGEPAAPEPEPGDGEAEGGDGGDGDDGGGEVDGGGCAKDCAVELGELEACREAVLDLETCSCSEVVVADGTPCDDGFFCNVEDRCQGGKCSGKAFPATLVCDDGNPCTLEDCDPFLGCSHLQVPLPCDDGDPCTGGEVCAGGACQAPTQYVCEPCVVGTEGAGDECEAKHGDGDVCTGVLKCVEGLCRLDEASVVTCPDGGACAEATCDAATGSCGLAFAPDGLPCTDGSVCTSGDACKSGACLGAAIAVAACQCSGDGGGDGEGQGDGGDADAECAGLDDGDLCNGRVVCVGGTCLFDPASVVTCEDGLLGPCASLACDPATGACVETEENEGLPCDDGDPCTLGDVCDKGSCEAPDVFGCEALDGPCRVGVCDPETTCALEPFEDGTACELDDPCVAAAECLGGDCVATAAATCDDQDDCTVDSCVPGAGCEHLGPPKPEGCADLGLCAGKLPVCSGGAYHCNPALVPGYSPVELCDGADEDCDGETDEDCLEEGGVACLGGLPEKDFGTGLQLCKAGEGVSAADLACGPGWHVCTYSQLAERAGAETVPNGYWVAAAVSFDVSAGTWGVQDVTTGGCVDMSGVCGGGRTLQAKTWADQDEDGIPYVTEAWGCSAGVPIESCETLVLPGVACCADTCSGAADCGEPPPCAEVACDPVVGECVVTAEAPPSCPATGVCSGGVEVVCGEAGLHCDLAAVAGYETAEASCDGTDNDCDGLTDAGDADLLASPPLCEKQEGVCAGASKAAAHCTGGAWKACGPTDYAAFAPGYASGAEKLCDGVDENCDGQTDESFASKGKPKGEPCTSTGVCGAGTVVCKPDFSGAVCSTAPGVPGSPAGPEACNGQDDDCDGQTDEAAELDPAAAGCPAEGVCAGIGAVCEEGGWVCQFEAVLRYEAAEVSCDGYDNDCDGDTDEEFTWLGEEGAGPLPLGSPCGPAECTGAVVCSTEASEAVCSAGDSDAPEVCDGLDNDCDGETDEGVVWTEPGSGETAPLGGPCAAAGECASTPGLVACGAGSKAVCSTGPGGAQSAAVPETCNDKDDDCDGATDDGMAWKGIAKGLACDGTGLCGAGEVVCGGAGAALCSTDPGGPDHVAVAEDCNGQDDDCDGATDEEADLDPLASDCLFEGVCTAQNVLALCDGGAWSCDYSGAVPAGFQFGDEDGRCDGLDNDCDGATDEDFPTLGEACDGDDADLCETGTVSCLPGGAGVACTGETSKVESCNGLDDDCDGATDEAGATGCVGYFPDQDGDGAGAKGATAVCLCAPDPAAKLTATKAGDCQDGDAAVNPGAPEKCNGKDDDCDGKIDAEDALDLLAKDLQACELQKGVCAGTTKPAGLCQGGVWKVCGEALYEEASAQAFEGGGEASCDGKDNDCDGLTDAADPQLAAQAPPCTKQQGVCAGSKAKTCQSGAWKPCDDAVYAAWSAAYQAGEETSCDGKDNDCDGASDDPFLWDSKKVGQSCDGTGQCGPGTVECNGAKTAATCSTNADGSASQAVAETCNNKDDDCDGATDETLATAQSTCFQAGVCASGVLGTCTGGVWSCDYSGVAYYEPHPEASCDGKDNDCSGQADEDFTVPNPSGGTWKKGDPCGSGSCLGAFVCKSDQSGLVCSSAVNGGAEVCDGKDNDCDGQTDEGLTWNGIALGASCDGTGECGIGTVVCNANLQADCSTHASGPKPELCNSKDDDCDGSTDEGMTWKGLALGAGCDGTGECGQGIVQCAPGGAATCSTNPNGSASEAKAESCNAKDDDCDGQTDEQLGLMESPCKKVGVCAPPTGVVATCQGAAGWTCSYGSPHYSGDTEQGWCDGKDNDCDGSTDEDHPEKGTPCDREGDADQCAHGTWQCEPAGGGLPLDLVCVETFETPELCSTTGDDDCDGQANEPNAKDCAQFFRDHDQDTYGSPFESTKCACAPGDGEWTATNDDDCDDGDPDTNPAAPEVCGGGDEDCGGDTDEEGAAGCVPYWKDVDEDGWGSTAVASKCLCGPAKGFTAEQGGDCCDQDGSTHPGLEDWFEKPDLCQSYDRDCSGEVELEFPDLGVCCPKGANGEDCEKSCPVQVGWYTGNDSGGSIPWCGQSGKLVTECTNVFGGCFVTAIEEAVQRCR